MKVLVQGAGIAGPALAFWLEKYGHEVVVVEAATGPREGGYLVDLWGKGFEVLQKMGLLEKAAEKGYHFQRVQWVDKNGKQKASFNAGKLRDMVNGSLVTVERSALSKVLLDSLEGKVAFMYGDSIERYDERADGVHVGFKSGKQACFDILVAADGLRSKLRELAFGPFDQFEHKLNMRVAAFDSNDYPHKQENCFVAYTEPGLNISRVTKRDGKTLMMVSVRDRLVSSDRPPRDIDEIKQEIRAATAGSKWREVDEVLGEMDKKEYIYYDSVSQVRMKEWSKGRVVLLGDAAACVSLLAGEGIGLALMEAYVLAGEINRAEGDYATAFRAYEDLLHPFLESKQTAALKTAGVFLPDSRFAIWMRNTLCWILPEWLLVRLSLQELKDHIELPEYECDVKQGDDVGPARLASV